MSQNSSRKKTQYERGHEAAKDVRLPVNSDYAFTPTEERTLGVHLGPSDMRIEILTKFHRKHGTVALINFFSNFIGLANSISNNTREFIELYLITECGQDPHIAERINLPTVLGAINGMGIAVNPNTPGMCTGCAFRQGTQANQSLITTTDARDAVCGDIQQPFICHMQPDPERPGAKQCRGYDAARRDARKGGGR